MRVSESAAVLKGALDQFRPTHIVSMVSGGKDSAASDAIARELGVKIDFVIHGNTRTGIPETSQFVRDNYGNLGDYVEADAGSTYEDRLLRKGFYGVGRDAHNHAFRELKVTWFRKAISHNIRHGKRDVRVLMLNGARKDESENRKKNLKIWRPDPASPNNIWVNLIHDWTQDDRDTYLETRGCKINPVAKALCRSGECMCGTMQSKAERIEAAILYPKWGAWLTSLEAAVCEKFAWGWGDRFPGKLRPLPLFEQLGASFCSDCSRIPEGNSQ